MKRTSNAAVAAMATLVFCLSACGDNATESQTNADGSTSITVGLSPNASALGFYDALDKGYFRNAGLDIETKVLQSGSQSTPLLLNGDLQISFTDIPSVALANEKGISIKFVAAAQYFAQTGPTTDAIVVAADSPLKTAADLEGKTVAVAGLISASEINMRRAVAKAGGDYTRVNMVELPQASTVAAVESGKVDAATLFDPFVAQAKAAGLKIMVRPGEYANPGALVTGFAATDQYLASNSDTAKAFTDAVNRGNADVIESTAGDKALVKELIGKYTKIPVETVDAMVLPTFIDGPLDPATLEASLDSMTEYGHLNKNVDASNLVWGQS